MITKIEDYFQTSVFREYALEAISDKNVEGLLSYLDDGSNKRLKFVFDCLLDFKKRGLLEEAFFNAYIDAKMNNSNISLTNLKLAIQLMDREKILRLGAPLKFSTSFRVYRGVAGLYKEKRVKGISWTGKKEVAAFFALRGKKFLKNPSIYTFLIKPENVLFYTDERNEDEYVIMPPKNFNPKKLKITNDEMMLLSELYKKQYE